MFEEIQENKNIRIIEFSIQIWAAPKHKLEALVFEPTCSAAEDKIKLAYGKLQDIRLPLHCKRDQHSSEILRSHNMWLVTSILGQPISPSSRDKQSKKNAFFLDCSVMTNLVHILYVLMVSI